MPFNESNILKRLMEAQQAQEEPSNFEESLQAANNIPEQIVDDVTLTESAPAPEAPVTPEEIEVAQANNQVEAFNAPKGIDRQIAGEIDQAQELKEEEPMSERELMLKRYRDLIASQEEALSAPKKKAGLMDILPDALAGAHNILNYAQGSRQPMLGMDSLEKRQAAERQSQADQLTKQSKLQGLLKDYLAMTKPQDETEARLKEAQAKKAEAEAERAATKKDEPSFEEKERIKADIKQKIQDEKGRKEEIKTTKESIGNVDEQLEKIKRAKQLMKDLAKKGKIADTGPLDQYVTGMTKEGQALRQAFNDLSLDKMTKMFKGMSKAIDSDAERKMFEQSQASLSNYPSVNLQVLDNLEKALMSTKQKNIQYQQELTGMESEQQESSAPYGDEVQRGGKTYRWNPAVGKYQLAK